MDRALVRWKKIIAGLEHAPSTNNGAVENFLHELEDALTNGKFPPDFARLPGPFARSVVHALDRFATSSTRIKSYNAISHTARRRASYFPSGVDVRVVYPPPRLQGFYNGSDDYLFTVRRLDGPKRMGLIIEAMRHVKADIPLLIGGEGPDEHRLRKLAADESRIKFLGTMTDAEVLDAYANALAVPFDEDLGLITMNRLPLVKPLNNSATTARRHTGCVRTPRKGWRASHGVQ